MTPFSTLSLSKDMLENLKNLGYDSMTAIQEAGIPPVLAGHDILAQAKTGSGKTAAFGIGLLQNLKVERFRVQALVLCPTRELAEQVTSELRRIARFRHNIKILRITGGLPMHKQELSLKHQAHVVVGTPGRINKLLKRESLVLDEVKTVVLDEADRMLDMGFIEQIENILKYTPVKRQTLCFSATYPEEIKKLSRNIQNKPREIAVETEHDPMVITQRFYEVSTQKKTSAVIALLAGYCPESAIIFCNTKDVCRRLGNELNEAGFHCLALHGDLEQKERTEVLIRFSNRSSRILVATDVAARGLDIDDLSAVINYDMPFETENYVHRIGRTGRAGREGLAFSLLKPGEGYRLSLINEFTQAEYSVEPLSFENKSDNSALEPSMVTISINGGRKNKISPGDLLGALTSEEGIPGSDVGKIDRLDNITFVAVKRKSAAAALRVLEHGLIKGRVFKVMIHD